eukprot:CAMPEP_0202733532 /NCGR_PEP_ID=MMETSP1385-20130828/188217_1 /ASSEMBLY_ACC=CAM_ASM_000861 /TAXON_ID=933848 /ORGANISM="Elphidium margaritaceum" /LENGTH=255 /DNA_ID=CAMNT_0049399869 /DNA_START=104 /DNA_END=871 /DNA_ORIENTATION=-
MTTDGYDYGPQTTEWDDALRKHKILPKLQKPATNDAIDTKMMWEEKQKDPYADKTLEELDELEDDIDEDKLDYLRKQRLAELQEKAKQDKFGRVQQISKPEYTKEVTEASKQQPVLCCLFVWGQEESQILLKILEQLAAKFKAVKFTKIVGQDCIENYKDSFCPTLVIYKDGDPVGNIKGLFNFGGKKLITADIVEWELAQTLDIWKTTLEENPRKFKFKKIGGANNNANKKYTVVKKNNEEDDGDDSGSDLDIE